MEWKDAFTGNSGPKRDLRNNEPPPGFNSRDGLETPKGPSPLNDRKAIGAFQYMDKIRPTIPPKPLRLPSR